MDSLYYAAINVFYGFLGNILYAGLASVVAFGYFMLSWRRRQNREFRQILGVYLSFHRTVGKEANDITVNVMHIYKKWFGLRGIAVNYLNGAQLKNGTISALYSYSGSVLKGDPEYHLNLYCNQLKEALYGVIPAASSSPQLCPWLLVARDFRLLPYASIGVIVGIHYFVHNLQKQKEIKHIIGKAIDYSKGVDNNPSFIMINISQHDLLKKFKEDFNIEFIEKLNPDSDIINHRKYNRNTIYNIGPYL